jgi:hypothetical protein
MEPDKRLKLGIFYFWHIDIAAGPAKLVVIPDNAIDLVMSPDVADFSACAVTLSTCARYLSSVWTLHHQAEGPILRPAQLSMDPANRQIGLDVLVPMARRSGLNVQLIQAGSC